MRKSYTEIAIAKMPKSPNAASSATTGGLTSTSVCGDRRSQCTPAAACAYLLGTIDGGKFDVVQDETALAISLVRSRVVFPGSEPNSDGGATFRQFEFAPAAESMIGQFFNF